MPLKGGGRRVGERARAGEREGKGRRGPNVIERHRERESETVKGERKL